MSHSRRNSVSTVNNLIWLAGVECPKFFFLIAGVGVVIIFILVESWVLWHKYLRKLKNVLQIVVVRMKCHNKIQRNVLICSYVCEKFEKEIARVLLYLACSTENLRHCFNMLPTLTGNVLISNRYS